MVYSHLPSPTTETLHITRPAETHGHLIMHYTRFPTSLLSTCRRLNEEVAPVLTKAYDACVFETTHAFDTVNPKCLENVLCLLILTGIMSNVRFAAESAIEETAREVRVCFFCVFTLLQGADARVLVQGGRGICSLFRGHSVCTAVGRVCYVCVACGEEVWAPAEDQVGVEVCGAWACRRRGAVSHEAGVDAPP